MTNLAVTGAATTSALTVSNNATVGGTLGVTGAATFLSLRPATEDSSHRDHRRSRLSYLHLATTTHYYFTPRGLWNVRIHWYCNIYDDHCRIIDRHQREYLDYALCNSRKFPRIHLDECDDPCNDDEPRR